MALIDCPECSGKVSSAAAACPVCGHPILQAPADVAPPIGPPVQVRKAHNGLHFFLTIVTLGMWLPIWIGVVIWTNYANRREAQGRPYMSGGKVVGIGFAIWFGLMIVIAALGSVMGASTDPTTAASDTVESTTTSTRPSATPETATPAQLTAMTTGLLRIGVDDILDSSTCEDLVFDFDFFRNNNTVTPMGERILNRASELAARDIGCSTYPMFP